MTPSVNLTTKQRLIQREMCRRSAHYFIFDSHLLQTKDEHDMTNPAKLLPDKPYLRCMLDLLLLTARLQKPHECKYLTMCGYAENNLLDSLYEEQILLGDKSRQIMATWLVASYILWRAKFFAYQSLFVQSKKEEDAAAVVSKGKDYPELARITFMESHLPVWLQNARRPYAYKDLSFETGSTIIGIPQGGDVIRSHVPSVFFSDEAAFQPEFDAAYSAALPAVDNGGQFIAVSSPELGAFAEVLAIDEEPIDEVQGTIPTFSLRRTPGGLPVLRVGFEADPDKNPATEQGAEWLSSITRKYPKGIEDPRFRKEYRFDYGAMGGTKLFPLWEEWKRQIVIPPFEPVGYKLYGTYDHGWRNPASFTVYGVDGDGVIVALWEFYGSNVGVPHIADIILGKDVVLADGRKFEGNPYAGREIWKLSDPQLWAEDQPMNDGTTKSVAELFRRYGVYFQKGERGGDTMVAEWLHGHFWNDLEHPLLKITTLCPKLIWEIGQQRHKQITSKVAINRDQPEELVDKDNHSWDALKFLLKKFPPKPNRPAARQQANTFNWWRNMARKGVGPNNNRTFRVG